MEELASLFSLAFSTVFVSGMSHYVKHATTNGDLGRNFAIGLRTRVTKSSDAAWEAGHKAAAPWLMACAYTGYSSSALTIVFVVFAAVGGFPKVGAAIIAGVGMLAITVILIIAAVIAHNSGKDALQEQG